MVVSLGMSWKMSWTHIGAWTGVMQGRLFARDRWRSLAKTTRLGMLQSHVAGLIDAGRQGRELLGGKPR